MNALTLPELFCLISSNLNDEEKMFLISCSKMTHNFKPLIKLDIEYSLKEINDKWHVSSNKNIIMKDFSLEDKIKELIKNPIPESIIVKDKYVKFISNNINIKLFYNEKIIDKIASYGYSYLAMRIILNNDVSIENINKQFIYASRSGYLNIVKSLIDLGADIYTGNNEVVICAFIENDEDLMKLLIENSTYKGLSKIYKLLKKIEDIKFNINHLY